LLKNKFDYIYLVGSKAVGKNVLRAAAEHLTPVTLELGGKSPCYIDESADIQLAAKRILSCKLINLGQVCVAPDYIICSQKTQTEFVRAAYFVIRDWFGGHTNLQGNPALARIINSRHCLRLKNLLEGTQGKIAMGGKVDVNDLWVEPTIVVDVPIDDVLMEDEIFGPILPIVTVPYLERAMEIINSR
jgi:acyl-CoA reductase-like NAD-dependent aldehyde dehydrogenase